MGFLDHSTNNIIVDAVLTDVGRRALAKNDGSFQIFQFALGDDEIDYNIIEQYGRAVGKEKIEKYTPVLEALTAGNLGLKNKIVSIDNEYLTHFPLLNISVGGTDNFTFNRTSIIAKRIDIVINPAEGNSANSEVQLIDSSYRVELNSLFFKILGEAPDVLYTDNTVVYEINAAPGTGDTLSTASIRLGVNTNLTDTTFDIYSTSGGNYIKTFMKVSGVNSGLSKTVELRLNDARG